MMTNKEWIEMYKTDMIRCVRCGTLEMIGKKMTGRNLGYGCCVPFELLPQDWGMK